MSKLVETFVLLIGIPISLGVIATTLIVTVITSLIHSRRHKTRS